VPPSLGGAYTLTGVFLPPLPPVQGGVLGGGAPASPLYCRQMLFLPSAAYGGRGCVLVHSLEVVLLGP
jgi:hypothetical protein